VPPSNLEAALEALLFSSDQPLSAALIGEALDVEVSQALAGLQALGEAYAARDAGIELREIAGGWMFVTTPAQSEWVGRMLRGKRRMRLSRPALETMAIIAYKQPVTKSEIEAIRGVDSTAVLATLLERDLVTIRGRSKVVGRPLLYGTTPEFLDYFGLKELSELPRPEELRALVAAREPEQLEMMEGEVVSRIAADLELAEAATEGSRSTPGFEDSGAVEASDLPLSFADGDDELRDASADDEDEYDDDEEDEDDEAGEGESVGQGESPSESPIQRSIRRKKAAADSDTGASV
jgi:segregation and condensation protein B